MMKRLIHCQVCNRPVVTGSLTQRYCRHCRSLSACEKRCKKELEEIPDYGKGKKRLEKFVDGLLGTEG